MSILGNPILAHGQSGGGGGTVIITDTVDTHGGTIREITTDPAATIIEALNASQNGVYTAPSGKAYSPVNVNVSGGGGGYTLLGSAEFTVNQTSTTATDIGTIDCGSSWFTSDKIIMVTGRDKAGKRNGYFTSHISYLINQNAKNGSSNTMSFFGPACIYANSSGVYQRLSAYNGVYGYNITSAGVVTVRAAANANMTINGTYVCEVWALDYPANFNPWGD